MEKGAETANLWKQIGPEVSSKFFRSWADIGRWETYGEEANGEEPGKRQALEVEINDTRD